MQAVHRERPGRHRGLQAEVFGINQLHQYPPKGDGQLRYHKEKSIAETMQYFSHSNFVSLYISIV